MKKIALFAFNGDPMCFIHVLLNALDLNEKGHTTKIIMEGAATGLVATLNTSGNPLQPLWQKALGLDLIDGVCKACSNKMGALSAAETQGLKQLDDMSGHPSMARYMADGFEIISF
jgi:hypothetical protein